MASFDLVTPARDFFILGQLSVENFLSRPGSSSPEEHHDTQGAMLQPFPAGSPQACSPGIKRVKEPEPEYKLTPSCPYFVLFLLSKMRGASGGPKSPCAPRPWQPAASPGSPGDPRVPSRGCAGLSPALDLILDLQIIQVTAPRLFVLPVFIAF